MGILMGLFMAIGGALGGQQGMILGFIFAVATNFFSYWFSDKIVLKMYRAQEIDESKAPELYAMVRRLALAASLPMPKVYIIDNSTPNAFATGRNPENAVVAVTTGILQLLDQDELSGVIGHELAHIKHRDILIGSIAATFAGAIAIIANFAKWAAIFGGGRGSNDRGANPMALIATAIFAPMAAMLIQMAISRSREYAADERGGKYCGNPIFLARALQKLEHGVQSRPMDAASPSTAHMFIINPFAGLGGVSALFRTHPVTEERIKRLEQQAGQRLV